MPDTEKFPGHIACDGASRSEIVVPIVKDGKVSNPRAQYSQFNNIKWGRSLLLSISTVRSRTDLMRKIRQSWKNLPNCSVRQHMLLSLNENGDDT